MTHYYLHKSNQNCSLLPYQASSEVRPYPSGYERVVVEREKPTKTGRVVDVLVVRADSLRKRINNATLPKGTWIHL